MRTTEITEAAELLALLRAAPTLRAIAYPDARRPAVCECTSGDPVAPSGVLAWIADQGSARDLLTRAYRADREQDTAAWAALSLRYGPYCSTWILPEHPRAPARPDVGSD